MKLQPPSSPALPSTPPSQPHRSLHLLSPERSWPGHPGTWLSCHVAGRKVSISKQKTVSETCGSLAACPLAEDAVKREGLRAGREGALCPPGGVGTCAWLAGTPSWGLAAFSRWKAAAASAPWNFCGEEQAAWQGPQPLWKGGGGSRGGGVEGVGRARRAERASPLCPPPTAEGSRGRPLQGLGHQEPPKSQPQPLCEAWTLGRKTRERKPDFLQAKLNPSCWWEGICEK